MHAQSTGWCVMVEDRDVGIKQHHSTTPVQSEPEITIGTLPSIIDEIEHPRVSEAFFYKQRIVRREDVGHSVDEKLTVKRSCTCFIRDARNRICRHAEHGAQMIFDERGRDVVIVVDKEEIPASCTLDGSVARDALPRSIQLHHTERQIGKQAFEVMAPDIMIGLIHDDDLVWWMGLCTELIKKREEVWIPMQRWNDDADLVFAQ